MKPQRGSNVKPQKAQKAQKAQSGFSGLVFNLVASPVL